MKSQQIPGYVFVAALALLVLVALLGGCQGGVEIDPTSAVVCIPLP
jgi:hypothetical protein